MGRLAAKDSNDKRPFKSQIYKSRGSYPHGQNRSYNQRSYQNRGRLGSRSDSRNRGQYGNNRPGFQQNYRDNNFQENTRGYGRQNSRGEYRDNRHDDYNRSRDRSQERTFSRNYGNNRDRSSGNRDRIRCYNCREYDHFARDCPTSREERDLE